MRRNQNFVQRQVTYASNPENTKLAFHLTAPSMLILRSVGAGSTRFRKMARCAIGVLFRSTSVALLTDFVAARLRNRKSVEKEATRKEHGLQCGLSPAERRGCSVEHFTNSATSPETCDTADTPRARDHLKSSVQSL